MKGLYVSNIDPTQSIGYMPKILGQLKGFKQLGYEMNLLCFNQSSHVVLTSFSQDSEYYLKSKVLAQNNTNLITRRLSLLRLAEQYISERNPDFIYLRYPRSEPLYLYFLAKVRQKRPNLLILSEFPTYPYDQEYEGGCSKKDKLVFLLDKITRNHLKYFIDRVVAINYAHPIFGIDTISIDNGIDISSYHSINYAPVSSDHINIIGVANVSLWHGYDRLIRGLGEYYRTSPHPKYQIVFHVVGAREPYLTELLTLAEQENVSHLVIFHKPTQGKELDEIFLECHLAVGVLGGHRKGLHIMSPLKNREYCVRGIPFIFSHIDPDFPDSFKYCLQLDSSEDAVDISDLISFVEQLRNEENINVSMRNHAFSVLDWSVKLKAVQNYIDKQLI
ncbi:glycosyltransferase family 4 protein [Adonisia turfae]|nr:glycosyltransferase family 4 protein [Adonisia turfae]